MCQQTNKIVQTGHLPQKYTELPHNNHPLVSTQINIHPKRWYFSPAQLCNLKYMYPMRKSTSDFEWMIWVECGVMSQIQQISRVFVQAGNQPHHQSPYIYFPSWPAKKKLRHRAPLDFSFYDDSISWLSSSPSISQSFSSHEDCWHKAGWWGVRSETVCHLEERFSTKTFQTKTFSQHCSCF